MLLHGPRHWPDVHSLPSATARCPRTASVAALGVLDTERGTALQFGVQNSPLVWIVGHRALALLAQPAATAWSVPCGRMRRHRADPPSPITGPSRSRGPFLPGTESPTRRRHVDAADFEELAALVADATVTDVLVVGGRGTWIDRGQGLERTGPALPERRVRELAVTLVAQGGRHVDETTPCADVRHGDGIRVHVVLAPVSVGGTAVSIRLPSPGLPTLASLERLGAFARVPRGVVERAVEARRNVLVTGVTGSGKTTMLAAMLGAVPPDERIVTVEDVAEASLSAVGKSGPSPRQPTGRIAM